MAVLPPIVCDTGSSMIKCGFYSSETPEVQFPAAVARRTLGIDGLFFDTEDSDDDEVENVFGEQNRRHSRKRQLNQSPASSAVSNGIRGSSSSILVGHDALATADQSGINANYPLVNGVVTDWDDMLLVWDEAFLQLLKGGRHGSKRMKLAGGGMAERGTIWESDGSDEWLDELKGGKILQTEAACNPTKNRERILTEMFERYGFGSVNVSVQAVLSLLATGQRIGMVVDSGDGVTHVVPIYEGFVLQPCVKRMAIAGRTITRQLAYLVTHTSGNRVKGLKHLNTMRQWKEEHCFVSDDPARTKIEARRNTINRFARLPDGTEVPIGAERYLAPEILFTPAFAVDEVFKDQPGIQGTLMEAIDSSPLDIRESLQNSVLLSGGNTLLDGFGRRLNAELGRAYGGRARVVERDDRM
ncbi:actin, partial [Perkinsus olseni]